MSLSPKTVEALLKATPQARYEHFVHRVADWEQAWGLYKDGWALYGTPDGKQAFALWPAKEYAEHCALESWSTFEPTSISLNELFGRLLPALNEDGMLIAVFPTPNDRGIVRVVKDLAEDLRKYLGDWYGE